MLADKRRLSRDVIVPVQFDAGDMAGLHSSLFKPSPLENDLADMDWMRYETWTRDRIEQAGLEARSTPRTGDGGADIIARTRGKPPRAAIVQVKHRSNGREGTVSTQDITDVLRARDRYRVENPVMVLVTNGSIDPLGNTTAQHNRITVVDYSTVAKVGQIVRNAMMAV